MTIRPIGYEPPPMTRLEQVLGTTAKFNKKATQWLLLQRLGGHQDIHLARTLLGKGDVFVDVGANLGVFVAAASQQGANVIAFEPLPHLAERLTTRVGRNVRIRCAAVGREISSTTLYVPWAGAEFAESRASVVASANSELQKGYELTVPIVDLDSEIERADLIKIDVEGGELEVLDGASRLITNETPVLLVEVEDRHHQHGGSRHVLEKIESYGYQIFYNQPGRRKLLSAKDFDFAFHQRSAPKYGDRQSSEGYTNNFLAIHPRQRSRVLAKLQVAGWEFEQEANR